VYKMSWLIDDASCGTSNPVSGLMKQLVQDKSLQQDRFISDQLNEGTSKKTFRSRTEVDAYKNEYEKFFNQPDWVHNFLNHPNSIIDDPLNHNVTYEKIFNNANVQDIDWESEFNAIEKLQESNSVSQDNLWANKFHQQISIEGNKIVEQKSPVSNGGWASEFVVEQKSPVSNGDWTSERKQPLKSHEKKATLTSIEMASAVFVLDLKGKVLISRNYRGDIPMSAVEKFMPLVLEAEEEQQAPTPLLALTKKNSNATTILLFLHKLAEEESIRDNFVIIYELLDEMMDFGYPQTTETKILQE
ncbi:26213_t:CDS:10, partial [Dentiscutata erythropus]